MCRFKLSALYWVRTKTRRKSELMQFQSVMSMMRYSPPNGTAGLARSRVSGHNRSPCPPASNTPMASRIADMADPPRVAWMARHILTTEWREKTNGRGASVGLPRARLELPFDQALRERQLRRVIHVVTPLPSLLPQFPSLHKDCLTSRPLID